MKIIRKIMQYILAIILALAILILIAINIVSSYILNKDYILSKLNEQNYYEEIYIAAKSNFENYIYQSGLDESVIENIITKEKIEKDTKIIISNIYDGMNEQIDTDEIKNNLNENIQNSLEHTPSASEQEAIDQFVNTICNEYETTIIHTKYEEKINDIFTKLLKCIDVINKATLVIIGVCVIAIMLLTIKRMYKMLARIGVAFTIDGLILIIVEQYINTKVKIQGITIFNNGISNVLRDILTEMLNKILTYGGILLSLGIILIIIYAIIKGIRKANREREQYTPEN